MKSVVAVVMAIASLVTVTLGDFPDDVAKNMDLSIDPCEDFYEYTCGGWLRNFTLPDDRQTYSLSFNGINDRNDVVIEQILRGHPPVLGELWDSCMALDALNSRGGSPLQPTLQKIAAVKTKRELMQLAAEIGTFGPSMFTDVRVGVDVRDATTNILYAATGDLVLPAASYYTDAASFGDVEPAYRHYIASLLSLAGITSTVIFQPVDVVMKIEKQVAEITPAPQVVKDPIKSYHRVAVTEAAALFPLTVGAVVEGLTLLEQPSFVRKSSIVLTSLEYFTKAEMLAQQTPLEQLKIYLTLLFIDFYAPYLGEPFVQASFELYSKKLGGQKTRPSRVRVCKRALTTHLPDLIGEHFAANAFDQERGGEVQTMIQAIEKAMGKRIAGLDWLDDTTRVHALNKLEKVANLVGKPSRRSNVSFKLEPDDYFGNIVAISKAKSDQALRKLGLPVDRSTWLMSPATANAYYSSTSNTIVFPAAILQAPLYTKRVHPARNFGAIGAIIGHELTHGFDQAGRQFNGDGSQDDWWTATTAAAFDTRAQCLRDQYGGFKVEGVDGSVVGKVSGNMTIGENIADNGGLKLALDAFRSLSFSVMDDLEAEKLFFIAFGQIWCNKSRDGYLKQLLASDAHAPSKVRVNGVAMNSLDFARVFLCKPGSPMNPVAKCTLW